MLKLYTAKENYLPEIEPGDELIIDTDKAAEPGAIALVMTQNADEVKTALHRVYPQTGGGLLMADNDHTEPRAYTCDQCLLIGCPVRLFRNI